MTKNKINIKKGSSSAIIPHLLGDVEKYVRILEKKSKKLIKKYPSKNLAQVFSILPRKIITIAPMAVCDDLVQDLGGSCDENILAAIGLCCFPITTHDDVVDETPKNMASLAALVYAGNITGLEGFEILFQKNLLNIAQSLIASINENHYRQQFRVELLWQKKPKNFRDYLYGIEDVYSLMAIGPLCALSITGRKDLQKTILRFSKNCGFVLQLIDDIREFEEDKLTSYTSYPLLEGKPFKKSFQKIDYHLLMAKKALKPTWKRIQLRIKNIEDFIKKIKEEFL